MGRFHKFILGYFGNIKQHLVVRHGKKEDLPKASPGIMTGEIVFNVDTGELMVGNNGKAHPVTKVVLHPVNGLLYAEVPDSPQFLPIGVYVK